MADLNIRIQAEDDASPVIEDVIFAIEDMATDIVAALKGAEKQAETTGDKIRKALSFWGGFAKGLFGGLVKAAGFAARAVVGAFSVVGDAIAGAFRLGVSLVKGILNGLVSIVQGIVSTIGKVLEGIAGAFGLVFNKVTAIITAATGFIIGKLGQQAAAFESLDTGLTNLAKSAGTNSEAIRRAITKGSKGTITQIDAMRLANQALLLGVAKTPEEFEEISRIGLVLAQTMGIDMTQGLESLVVGIGRQSKLWLDNLGIIIDTEKAYQGFADELGVQVSSLDDVQKKQAFLNATLDRGRELVTRAGGATAGLTVQFSQLRVALSDTFTDLSRLVAPALSLVASEIVPVVQRLREWADANRDIIAGQITEHTAALIEKTKGLIGVVIEWKARIEELVPVIRDALSDAWERVKSAAVTTFEFSQIALSKAKAEVLLFWRALRGEGFDPDQSILIQTLRLAGAEAKVVALEINRAISLSFGDLIAQAENTAKTLGQKFELLGSPKAVIGGFERVIGRTFNDPETFARGTARVRGALDDSGGLARPTTTEDVAGRSERQLEAAIEQRDQQLEVLKATTEFSDKTTRTIEDMTRLQILQIEDATERARQMELLNDVVRDLQAQVRSIPSANPTIVTTGG